MSKPHKASKVLRLSEEQFRRAIEEAPIPTIMQAEDGQVLQISRSWTELTGYSLNDIPTFDNWVTSVVYDGADAVRNHMHVLFKGHAQSINVEFTIKTINRAIRVWSFNASSPGALLDGRRFIIGMAVDITERKKAEEANKRQQQLIDLSPDATIIKNKDGAITFWSKGAETLYGYTRGEALGQSVENLLKTVFPKPRELINSELEEKRQWSGELIRTTKYGQPIIVQSSWIIDGSEVLESNVNITEFKIKERALRERTDQLEHTQKKLEENAITIAEYATRMEELATQRADQLKNAERLAAIGATAGMVGHDIRNPLQAIISDVYLAKSELSPLPDSEGKKNATESLNEIEKNVFYINKIVSDLQDYARPLAPVAKEVSLKNIISEVFRNLQISPNIKIVVDVKKGAEMLTADHDLMKRIIGNLINNAVQAMPEGGTLALRAYRDQASVVIRVQDTGKGIPEEIKPKLFTPLFTTKSKGQGFGLAVVKRLTEALGGTVTFESELGSGTVFIVRFPAPKK